MMDTNEAGQALPDIPGYRVLRMLGIGGMSTIYLGEQRSLHRQVAIKVMLPDALTDETSRRRFENEARTIARLEHPHIVGIHDVGRTKDGLPYYAMPYLARGHLGQRDLTGDHARIRTTLRALLSALGYAHARGVIHRDVKAENVLFDEAERPLLADFGIALRRGYGSRVTSSGMAVGSTAYMAPEQARGEEVDFRADLYSVGVLTWELLTGELPFKAGDALSMAVKHAQDPIPRLPSQLRHWQSFIDRALAKSPRKRFRDVDHMLSALDQVPQRTLRAPGRLAVHMRSAKARLKRLPAVAWVAAVLVLTATAGLVSRDGAQPGFFRAQPGGSKTASPGGVDARGLPVPGADARGPIVANPEDAMLRAAPESTAEVLIAGAERQMDAGKLHEPASGNAYESLLTAWNSDRGHLRLPPAIDRLIGLLAADAVRDLGKDRDKQAAESVTKAQQLAALTARADGKAVQALRASIAKVLEARVDRAAAAFDRPAALRAIAGARQLGLTPAQVKALDTRARRVPQPGDRVADAAGDMLLLRAGDDVVAAARRAVSRNDYAVFATVTRREETLCRERASLLRIVARRSWKTPGFDQDGGDPVVCVSWQDAAAYADWLSRRHGQRYRLPSTAESRHLPPSGGSKQVAEWNIDCSGGCNQRVTTGTSWRGTTGTRPLEAARGYDDVGFRVVRDP